jgi:hypothetical protein
MGQFKFSTSKLGAATNPDAGTLQNIERLQVTQIALKADTGIQDFSFLNHLTVMAANSGYATQASPGRPVLQIVDYRRRPTCKSGLNCSYPWTRRSTCCRSGDIPGSTSP